MIVLAFANGDRRALKDLLSSEVYESFEAVIKDREKHEQKTETRFVSIDKAELVGAEARDRAAQLTVRFVSQMISVTRDKAGTIVDGNPDKVADITDVWTFARDIYLTRSELEAGWHGKRSLTRAARGVTPPRVGVIAVALSLAPSARSRASRASHRAASSAASAPLPYPQLEWPLEINGSQYAPVAWADIAGWNEDDHLQAYKAFRASCKPIAAQRSPPADPKALGASLRDPCRAAKALEHFRRRQGAGLLRGAFSAACGSRGSARARASSPATTSR